MQRIGDIMSKQFDSNMVVPEAIGRPDVKFYDVTEAPVRYYGVFREDGVFRRVPIEVAKTVSPGIHTMCGTNAGGRVRFMTDSPYVAIAVEYSQFELSCVVTNLNMVGFDMYADSSFVGAFRPPVDFKGAPLFSSLDIPSVLPCEAASENGSDERKMRLITIDMPSYSGVKNMHIGVAESAKISHAPDYSLEKPIVFYGSSITNGAAASRPGMTYEARLSRELDVNYINLGFGGLCKGEPEMAEYIAGLDMSIFVMDYDHNAWTLEHLAATHETFFKRVRESHPDIPIIIISRPNDCPSAADRFAIIKDTYENAKANGDDNVYLINGMEFFGGDNDFTVDRVHPTDLGFYFMAKRISEELRPIVTALKSHKPNLQNYKK